MRECHNSIIHDWTGLTNLNISRWYTLSCKQRHHILFWALTRLSKHIQNFWMLNKLYLLIRISLLLLISSFKKNQSKTFFFYIHVLYANVNLWEWHAIMKIPTCSRFSSKCSWWVFMLTSYSPNVPCMLSKHVHVRDSPIAQDVNKKNISDSSTCTCENVIVYKSLYLIVFCWLVLDSIFLLTFVKQ